MPPMTQSNLPTASAGNAVQRYLLAVAGTAVISGLLASALLPRVARPGAAGAPPAQAIPAAPQLGSVAVAVPAPLQGQPLRITLLQSGKPAKSEAGTPLAGLSPAELAEEDVQPGLYAAQIFYRGRRVSQKAARIEPGAALQMTLPERDLARVEYQAGLAADRRRAGDGIAYFRRAARLDDRHVDARLQLAAYELVHGSAEAVRNHLRAIRQIDPDNRDAAAVERLLKQRLARGR